MPKVSVMILTKDRPQFLRKALVSVAGQSFKDLEVVIGDNHSAADIKPMLEELRGQGLNIIHLYHEPGVSITENRQRVLKACGGEYVAPLDDDDTWSDNEKLQKQVGFMDSHPGVVLAGGGIEKVTDEGAPLGKMFRPQQDVAIRRTMLLRNNFFTSTVIFRKAVALAAGGFEFFENDLAEDYLFWLKMGLKGELYNFQEAFTNYRVPHYPKEKQLGFYLKQEHLIKRFKGQYSHEKLALLSIAIRRLKAKLF